MFALFLFLTCAWGATLLRRRDLAHKIHALMGLLVLCKTLTLLAQVRPLGVGAVWAGRGVG